MNDEKLVRGIGRWDLTAVVINTIIGAGIFGLPSKIYAKIGVYSLVAFVACAIVIALIVLCYAEVSSRFSSTGGPYLYAREAFGPAVAFEVGWLYWIVRVATFAVNCNLFVTYIGFFWPNATDSLPRIAIISFVVLMLAVVNVIGIRHSTKLTNFFTIGKLVPLFVFALVGLFFVHPENFAATAVPEYTSFTSAMLVLIYAFVGFEVAVIPAGETKDPRRDFPFALLVGLAVVAAIYIAVQIVCIGTNPSLAASERPLADSAVNFIGPYGAGFIALGALISILGNLNVGLIGGSRILYAMGENRELPGVLATVHSGFRTPYVSVVLNAVVILFLTIYSSFLSALAIATITRLIIYATTCAALPVFRWRRETEAGFRLPFGIGVAVLSLLLIVWLLTNVDFTKEGLPIVIAAAVGMVIYVVSWMFTSKKE